MVEKDQPDQLILADGIIDGVSDEPLQDYAVMVSRGRVRWIGSADRAPAGDYSRIEYEGCTLLPGLIDAHVHLTLDGTIDPWNEMVTDSAAIASMKAGKNLKRTLQSGVTTVRDLGSKDGLVIDIAAAIDKGLFEGPRVIAAGRCICMTGGHGYPLGMEVDGEAEARKAARIEMKRGARVLKVMATGGVITPIVEPGAPQLTLSELMAVVEEGHKGGRRVAAHAHGAEGIKNALRAGCDTIEHSSYLDEEAIQLYKTTDAAMVSTLIASMNPMREIDNPEMPEYLVRKLKVHAQRESQSLRDAIQAGIRLGTGTDAGAVLTPHGQMGGQLELLVEHGMTPIQAINTGTMGSAEAIGVNEEFGSLEPGKVADIFLVEGQPAQRIEDLMNVRAVYLGGNLVWSRTGGRQ